MVKRQKPPEIAGILEFEGKAEDDAEFQGWLAEHRQAKGGSIRVSRGGKGVRVMFTKDADMAIWKTRSEAARRRP